MASADKAGVEIFFAPDDTISDDVKKEYPEIKPTTKKQKLPLKIEFLNENRTSKTVQEALDYLEKMK